MTESASPQETLICPSCGQPTLKDANFCEHCGAELSLENGAQAEYSTRIEAPSETLVIRPEDLKKSLGVADTVGAHTSAFRTDIGHSHSVNQDAGGAWTWIRPDGTPASLIVVADGVSAGRHSEGASKLTVKIIHEGVAPLMEDVTQDVDVLLAKLLETVKVANHQVAQRPHHSVSSADATTIVAALCVRDRGAGVWCGDSRVYRIRDREVVQLTRDHSWAEGVVSHGIMSAEDAARDPRAHMITRWLGPPDQDDPGIEAFRFELEPGAIVMCCTDGLYMYFSAPASNEAEMASVLAQQQDDLQAGIDRLVDIALQRGGRDNITAAAIRVVPPSGDKTPTQEIRSRQSPPAAETVRFEYRKREVTPSVGDDADLDTIEVESPR